MGDVEDRVRQVSPLLAAAVRAVGGAPRPGQLRMAEAVAAAARSGEHLLVQAGTGTGKSLGYLVPAVAHAVAEREPVVVSTATLALQAQVVERDLPRVAEAVTALLGRRPSWQLVKGRRNYVCPHKVDGGFPEEDGLFEPAPTSRLGAELVRLREWAATTSTGDRDELVPGVSERAWRQVSVSARECLGQRCPQISECFCDEARERARHVDIVVTNHALVAIDAFENRSILPEHRLLVVDEAHELADRVTSVISGELTVPAVDAVARRARGAGVGDTKDLEDAGDALATALAQAQPGRVRQLPDELVAAVTQVRDAARRLVSELKADPSALGGTPGEGGSQLARAAATELFEVAERLAEYQDVVAASGTASSGDVVWVSSSTLPGGAQRVAVNVAPLSVAGLLREKLFEPRVVVLTSATLSLGGSFDPAAGAVGLLGERAPRWRGVDVGSPFDYPRQGILYIARRLPAPGRDGLGEEALAELALLVEAAGGRALGLFSSRRAAEYAAEQLRERLAVPVLCQGDDSTPTLVRAFAEDGPTCLFGTLSLWQGVDVPGPACQLVVVDRIPFPRPDDPLMSARQEAVGRAGGNGFMAVAASHAALLLAQGAGRLIRSLTDRGVVAVLDSRLATARYGSYLRTSLPPFWTTHDREVVLDALRRIDAEAGGQRTIA